MDSEIAERVKRIKNDRVHGASRLSREAVVTLRLAAERSEAKTVADFLEELRTVAAELVQARPGMASIANSVFPLIGRVLEKSQQEKSLEPLRSFARSEGDEIIRHSQQAALKAAQQGAGLIEHPDSLMTCSYSSTLCETLRIAEQEGKAFHVLAAESRSSDKAYGELAAEELKRYEISVEVIPDRDIELHVTRASKVLVGADSVLADGSIINGTPTRRLASAAKEAGVPFYSVCETAKLDIRRNPGEKTELEEGFDIVPPGLISGIITEDGMTKPEEIVSYIEKLWKSFGGGRAFEEGDV